MLTQKMQLQHITNLMAGIDEQVDLNLFDPKYAGIYELLSFAPHRERHKALDRLIDVDPNLEHDLMKIAFQRPAAPANANYEDKQENTFIESTEEVDFIWPDWIPRGDLSILVAKPGVGKSLFVLDLIRLMLHDQPLPDGERAKRLRHPIVYVDAENYIRGHTTRLRSWQTAGLWMKKHAGLYFETASKGSFFDYAEKAQQDALYEFLYNLQPDWLVIDSLTSAITNYTFDKEVRPIVAYFQELAQDLNMGITFIHHHSKRNSYDELENVAGAGLLVRAARTVIGLDYLSTGGEVDKKNDPRKVYTIKANENIPESLAFYIKPLHPKGVFLEYFDPDDYAVPTVILPSEQKVIDAIQDLGDQATQKKIVDAVGLGKSRVSLVLRKLVKDGRIENLGYGQPYKVL